MPFFRQVTHHMKTWGLFILGGWRMKNDALAKLSNATRALAEAKTLDEVKKIHNIAKAAETYARAAKLGLEAQNHAAEVKLRAERKAGEMLGILERGKTGPKIIGNDADNSEYRRVLDDTETPDRDASRWQTIAGMDDDKFEAVIGEAKEKKTELTSALMLKEACGPHVAHATGENEWYTPPEYIEAARAVMGEIDCDPASIEIANRIVKAKKFYSIKDDGLMQKWGKRIWMNPPYSQPLIAEFCESVTVRYESGEVEQACVLVNNATETTWFQRMLEKASAVCFIRGRVKFLNIEGNPGAPLQGQALYILETTLISFLYFFISSERFSKNE
jgi:ParB family chromosome partitioning protein